MKTKRKKHKPLGKSAPGMVLYSKPESKPQKVSGWTSREDRQAAAHMAAISAPEV